MKVSPCAGKPAEASMLVNVPRLVTAYYTEAPDPRAPGNGAPVGGLKVIAESGWFAARPSGTENICKIYAESLRGADPLRRIFGEAEAIVSNTLAPPPDLPQKPGNEAVKSWRNEGTPIDAFGDQV